MKKIFGFFVFMIQALFVFTLFTFFNLSSIDIKQNSEYECDNATVYEMIYNTETDINNYLYNKYGSYRNYSLSTSHYYGFLSVNNYNQSTLRDNYNALGSLRHDLNGDGVINNYDNVGMYEGICQPTAVSMALRYMAKRNDITFSTDINDVFYAVAGEYIDNGWTGGGAPRSLCYTSLNSFYYDNSFDYTAQYTESDILNYIDISYNNTLPAIAHISGDNGGHAVSTCGYFIKNVSYSVKVLRWYVPVNLHFTYVAINTGWTDSGMPDSGTSNMTVYNKNYSYIDLSNIAAVTYISEQ